MTGNGESLDRAFGALACFGEDRGLDRSLEIAADLNNIAKVSTLKDAVELLPSPNASAYADYLCRLGLLCTEEDEPAKIEEAALRYLPQRLCRCCFSVASLLVFAILMKRANANLPLRSRPSSDIPYSSLMALHMFAGRNCACWEDAGILNCSPVPIYICWMPKCAHLSLEINVSMMSDISEGTPCNYAAGWWRMPT